MEKVCFTQAITAVVPSTQLTLSVYKKEVLRGTLFVNFGPLDVDLQMFPPIVREQTAAVSSSLSVSCLSLFVKCQANFV